MAAAVSELLRRPPRLTGRATLRAATGGIAWGAIFTAGMAIYSWASCGIICIDEVAMTAAISMTAGVVTIGPVAAFAGRT
jgi:hypothetical protein